MATVNDLKNWINRDLTPKFGSDETYLEIVGSFHDGLKFRIYTTTNQYSIKAHDAEPHCRSYLGCTATCRKPRAGEDWTRGNDLADGELTEETWHSILADIIRYELVKVHKPK